MDTTDFMQKLSQHAQQTGELMEEAVRQNEYIKKADALQKIENSPSFGQPGAVKIYKNETYLRVAKIPAAEVVSKTAFEQVVWERDAALRQLREDYGVGLGEKKRDVAEVRPGEWIPVDEKRDAFDCSECDAMVSRMMNYCPNCGARMDKEDEHEAG